MLKIDPTPKFTTKVTVNTLAIQGVFDVTYSVLPSDELKAIDDGSAESWRVLLARVVQRFEPVDVAGETLNGGPEDLPKLIRWPGVGQAMLARYWAGLYEAAAGN